MTLNDYQRLIITLESLYRISDEYHNSKEAIRVMRNMIVKGQPIFTGVNKIEV